MIKFPYKNNYLKYANYAILTMIIALLLAVIILKSSINNEFQWLILMFELNTAAVFVIGFFLLTYIHYKSPHYYIQIDDNSVSIPKNALLPDSYFIHFNEISFEGEFEEKNEKKYKIVYLDQSIIIEKKHLRYSKDWEKLVFSVKEAVS